MGHFTLQWPPDPKTKMTLNPSECPTKVDKTVFCAQGFKE